MGGPFRLKPHHAEGAQRYMAWGKNESHKEMFDQLQHAINEDPNAELVFVRGFDFFCEKSCIKKGEEPPCAVEYGSASVVNGMDEEVAREHGWEFDKPYKVKDILEELRAEGSERKIFYICKLTREQYENWLADVQASKKHPRKK
jgi:hypothetical protein